MPKPVIPKTALEDLLNDTQRQSFADWLRLRHDTIKNQLAANLWIKRKTYEQQMNDDFTWRTGGGSREQTLNRGVRSAIEDDIFDQSNASLNVVGGFAAFMAARATDDIKGTDPYYNLYPEGVEDEQLAETLQKHSEWKLRASNLGEAIDDAIDLSFGIGEGVVKLRYDKDIDLYERKAEVAWHTGENRPIITDLQEFVFKDDVTTADVEAGATSPLDGTPVMSQAIVVPKDPTLVIDPAMMIWKDMAITETKVLYRGVRAETVYFKDFLVPLTAPGLRDRSTNFIGHRFQLRLSEAKALYNLSPEAIEQFETDSVTPKVDGRMPNTEQGEVDEGELEGDFVDPIIEFCECWARYDPVDDGRVRRIWAVLAVQYDLIVAMDYIANMTPDGDLPFFVVRSTRVKNRWYGRGYYEIYGEAQTYIDQQLNRIEYRNQFHTNPPGFFDDSKLVEAEDSDEPFRLTPGMMKRKKPGVQAGEIVDYVILNDLEERTWELMQLMIQMIQVRSGVTSAAQGEVSSLPSTATATGIESIMASASTLARLPIGNLKESIEPAVLYACKLIYANLDTEEAYTYEDGDATKVGLLQRASVEGLNFNVRLILTRFKNREQTEAGKAGIEIVNWYLLLPEQEKSGPRILGLQVLKGLGVTAADTILRPPIIPIDPLTGQPLPYVPATATPPQPAGPAGPPKPPGT